MPGQVEGDHVEPPAQAETQQVTVQPHVVEIAVNDIQASAQDSAGMALRFARVKRYRDDKPADEAEAGSDMYLFGSDGVVRSDPQ